MAASKALLACSTMLRNGLYGGFLSSELAPACLRDLFTRKQDVTNYSLRGSSTLLQLPLPKTESGKKSFSYDGAKVWNSIPESLRNCKSVSSFKAEIATHTLF